MYRPWPERTVYGTVRSMSSESTRKRVAVKRFVLRYGGAPAGALTECTLLPH